MGETVNSLSALILPPEFREGNNYEAYKKELEVWKLMKTCSAQDQGPFVFRSLKGRAKIAANELTVTEIGSENGLDLILGKLDKLYLTEKNQRICSVLEQFESFRRSPSMTVASFVLDFERLHNSVKGYEITYPDGVLAYRLMKAANMSKEHEQLLRATVETGKWSYESVKQQLGKIFNDISAVKSTNDYSLPSEKAIKLEETYFTGNSYPQVVDSEFSNNNYDDFDTIHYENFTEHDSYEQSFPSNGYSNIQPVEHDIYYGPSRGGQPWKWNSGSFRGRGNQGSWRQRPQQNYQNPRSYQRPNDISNHQNQGNKPNSFTMNPKDYRGFPTVCRKCRSTYHYWENCPHVSPQEKMNATPKKVMYQTSTQEDYYIALYQKASPTTVDEIICLMGETLDKAVIDSGCTKSCAGKKWYKSYCESLSKEEVDQMQRQETQSVFRFGDSPPVVASEKVLLPIQIGNINLLLETEIVSSDVPLLLSKETMKKAKAKLNFDKDTIELFGEEQNMVCTSSGHYAIPIRKTSPERNNSEVESSIVLFTIQNNSDNKTCAKKLHTQFNHATPERLYQLVKDAGIEDAELKKALEDVYASCDTCKVWKKTRPRPVVAFPLASQFNDTLAMDLKVYRNNSIYILHIIDHATRFSAGAVIRSKKAEVIVDRFFKCWVAIFGTPLKVLSDNGGEFANEQFIDMCQNLNINFITTAAEAPWSNGLVEKHNGIIGEAVAKIQEDIHCSVEIALCWALNAKNSLQNIYGFSPHQLVFGKNPNLPTVFNDRLPALEGVTGSELIAHHLNAQHAARQQMIKLESSEKLRRALRAQTRTHNNIRYLSGDEVFYKRDKDNRWRGPGRVVGQDGSKVLVKIPTGLISVHSSCVTLTSEAERKRLEGEVEVKSTKENTDISSVPTDEPDEDQFDEHSDAERKSYYDDINFHIAKQNQAAAALENVQLEGDVTANEGHIDDGNDPQQHAGGVDDILEPAEEAEAEDPVQDELEDRDNPAEAEPARHQEELNINNEQALPNAKQIIKYRGIDTDEWKRCLVLNRWGSFPGKRKCKHVINIRHLDDNTEESIDWKSGVKEWTPLEENILVASCLDGGSDDNEWKSVTENVLVVSNQSNGEFGEAKEKELQNWKNMKVYEEVDNEGQDCLSVRWVFSEKNVDEKKVRKARLVARGYEELLTTQRDSPTANKESSRVALAIISSKEWDINSLDIKAAFLQGKDLDRDIYLKPPKEAKCPGKLWKLKRCVYGLNDASRFWYFRVKEELNRLGCNSSKYDSSLFIYYTEELEGILVAHVDDFLWAGTEKFYKSVIMKLRETFRISTEQSTSFMYLGVELKATSSGIYVAQEKYRESLQELEIPSARCKENTSPITEEEREMLRSVIGKLNWLAISTRPDLAFDVCELSTSLKKGTVELLMKANKVVKKAKYNKVFLHFPSLDLENLVVRCYADASFANLPDGGSQGGLYVELVSGSQSAPIEWQSKRLSRTPRSTLAAETISMVDGMSSGVLAGKLLSEILHNSKTLVPVEGITDNYSLFETAHSTKTGKEKRLRIEISMLREAIYKNEFQLKWTDTGHQLADCLTKKGSDPRKLVEHITGKNII